MSNGYGDDSVDRYTDMAAYDRLPPPLRWMLRNAVSPLSVLHFRKRYLEERDRVGHRAALAECARRIAIIDARETLTAYGPTHPEVAQRDH